MGTTVTGKCCSILLNNINFVWNFKLDDLGGSQTFFSKLIFRLKFSLWDYQCATNRTVSGGHVACLCTQVFRQNIPNCKDFWALQVSHQQIKWLGAAEHRSPRTDIEWTEGWTVRPSCVNRFSANLLQDLKKLAPQATLPSVAFWIFYFEHNATIDTQYRLSSSRTWGKAFESFLNKQRIISVKLRMWRNLRSHLNSKNSQWSTVHRNCDEAVSSSASSC